VPGVQGEHVVGFFVSRVVAKRLTKIIAKQVNDQGPEGTEITPGWITKSVEVASMPILIVEVLLPGGAKCFMRRHS